MKRFIPVSTTLLTLATLVTQATLVTLTMLTVFGLAGCGGGSDNSTPARTYRSVDLPMGLELYALTGEQQKTFCTWFNDPAAQASPDPAQTGIDPGVVKACQVTFSSFALGCTVGQYDACAKAAFADPAGATPAACQEIARCPALISANLDFAPPSKVCDGVMMPGSKRWCDVDGTAKDMTTGLHWLKDADCGDALGLSLTSVMPKETYAYSYNLPDSLRWAAALSTNHCSLLDGSVAGDWSLPTADQFIGLTRGVEPVSTLTPRLFVGVVHPAGYYAARYYWTRTPSDTPGTWIHIILWPGSGNFGVPVPATPPTAGLHLPVREMPGVTSLASMKAGQGYSIAPANALNPVAGTSYSTRSYLTVGIWQPAPATVGLSAWANDSVKFNERASRIWYFDPDPGNPGYFFIYYRTALTSFEGYDDPDYPLIRGPELAFQLQVGGNSTAAGAQIIGWPADASDNRRWKPEFVEGGVMLKSKLSGLCMHIETNDGLFLRQDACDAKSPGQVFVLTPRQDR